MGLSEKAAAMNRVIVATCLFFGAAAGFNVSLIASPPLVNILSDESQKITCGVQKDSVQELHITSIVLQRTNEDGKNVTYALITSFAAAHVSNPNDSSIATTSGDVNENDLGEFLTVEWKNPADTPLGKYYCEVFGLDGLGHPLSIIEPITISAPTKDLDDVIEIVQSMQQTQKSTMEQINKLVQSCKVCGVAGGKRSLDLEAKMDELKAIEEKLMAAEAALAFFKGKN